VAEKFGFTAATVVEPGFGLTDKVIPAS